MKGSDKPLSPAKKVLIYIGVILAVLLVIVLICIAVMFFVPGTSVLGYRYVRVSSSDDRKFNSSTSLSITGIQAVDIISDYTNIFIYPNTEAGEIRVVHKIEISGFTKSIDANLEVDYEVVTKSFEEDNLSLKTLVYNITEPTGLMSNSSSYIYVYLPSDITLNTISARSNSGNILYSSKRTKKNEPQVISCTNLYLKTGEEGNVSITNEQKVSNYYLGTGYGLVKFTDISTLEANKIKYDTYAGTLEYANKKGTATIALTNGLYVKSNKQKGVGPTIRVDNLLGNLNIETFNGYYKFSQIGDAENSSKVTLTTNNSKINIGSVYGQVSVLSDGDNISNSINIDNLVGGDEVNNFDAGSGSIYIKLLSGSTSFNSTSGSIKVDNAKADSNIWAHSTSGNIDITFSVSERSNNNYKTTILSNTGNINVRNISNEVNLHILSSSKNSALNLTFTAVATGDSILNSNDRNMNITLVGTSNDLRHRIASTSEVDILQTAGVPCAEILQGEADSLLSNTSYKDYNYNYRVGYVKNDIPNRPYTSRGKLLIKSSGKSTMRTALIN